ncbi:DUF6908 domain-containing protein [Paraflavitalea pollutisoli]|uniref:DUF6908 domain-containing protein n=1 Tax=Paraflavitalea pollutisoli TaxID=3034143 RepID=UPI0023EDE312|nr:hypothetical protein [Paraflavitalea sp. H1-2-19X]
MVRIKKNTKHVFAYLIDKIGSGIHLTLEAPEVMPFCIDIAQRDIQTAWGTGIHYYVCHWFQQGEMMFRDPGMAFIVVDNRATPDDVDNLHIIPQLFAMDYCGIYRQSAIINNHHIVSEYPSLQQDQAAFLDIWFTNLQQQGFIQ